MAGGPVIHVVDDDPSFRAAISRLLNVSGYEVADYESAAVFLRALEDAKPGCILLDVKMPAVGGLQWHPDGLETKPSRASVALAARFG